MSRSGTPRGDFGSTTSCVSRHRRPASSTSKSERLVVLGCMARVGSRDQSGDDSSTGINFLNTTSTDPRMEVTLVYWGMWPVLLGDVGDLGRSGAGRLGFGRISGGCRDRPIARSLSVPLLEGECKLLFLEVVGDIGIEDVGSRLSVTVSTDKTGGPASADSTGSLVFWISVRLENVMWLNGRSVLCKSPSMVVLSLLIVRVIT